MVPADHFFITRDECCFSLIVNNYVVDRFRKDV